jgi:CRISPR-associated protein Cas1
LALARTNEQLSVSMRGHLIREIAIHTIDQILAMGPCSMTSPALMLCTEHGVGLHVMDARKKVTASLAAAGAESVQLRRTQYRACADDATCLRLAIGIVCQKITNSKTIIARFLRHHPAPEGDSGLAHLHDLAVQSRHAATLDALRGYEGAAARAYFGLVRAILPPEWCFGARVSHPPADPVNALFSYGYAILYGNCATLVQRRGLDPAFAFLHAPHEGHLALASDLMEPYRAVIVDAVVLSLIFRRQVRPDDFATEQDETVNCHINLSARRTLIHALEEKFNSRPAGSTQDFRRIMAQDITSLAQHIEGHIPSWEPYIA